jgi:dihydrofolate synthase/folylpolyglutamate synthase
VIMPISLDHQPYLGDRVELIAAEKAGIMKRAAPWSSASRNMTRR